jgi:ribonuclease P protein component
MDDQRCKVSRLKRSGEFRRVREAGVSFVGKWLVFGVWKSAPRAEEGAERVDRVPAKSGGTALPESPGPQPPRFGVVTSRKVGGAVVRNKVRRRIRHIQQKHLTQICGGVWCVTVARFRAAEATFAELDAEWCKLAQRAGILCA